MRFESADNRGSLGGSPAFVLYVEGARDRDILLIWARRLSPPLVRLLEANVVILGGRQPARAVAHFEELVARVPTVRGICVLDRDDEKENSWGSQQESGLEFFTWSRRHIESYLLVRPAILRCLRRQSGHDQATSLVDQLIPDPEDEEALKAIDAKRLLSSKGLLARGLGQVVQPGRIARALRQAELHADVLGLMDRLQAQAGVSPAAPQVVTKSYSRS